MEMAGKSYPAAVIDTRRDAPALPERQRHGENCETRVPEDEAMKIHANYSFRDASYSHYPTSPGGLKFQIFQQLRPT
jgi:hypothetical protein